VLADILRLDAVWALFVSAVVNGFVAIPLLIGVLLTSNRKDLMGKWTNGRASRIWLIITIVLMTIAAIGVVVTA
jgi:Mn2+/Fe2+ NRAMP family transporter